MNFKTFKAYCLSKPGVTQTYPMKGEVDRLMADGKKIEAIKVLREAAGLGLKLSKMAVERRMSGR